jgi:hypothetical protein
MSQFERRCNENWALIDAAGYNDILGTTKMVVDGKEYTVAKIVTQTILSETTNYVEAGRGGSSYESRVMPSVCAWIRGLLFKVPAEAADILKVIDDERYEGEFAEYLRLRAKFEK